MKRLFTNLKIMGVIVCFATMIALLSCHNYYKIRAVDIQSKGFSHDVLTDVVRPHRYFILRTKSQAWNLRSCKLSEDHKSIHGILDTVSYQHQLYLTKDEKDSPRYSLAKNEQSVLSEIHFYLNVDVIESPGAYTLVLDKLTKIEFVEYDSRRSTLSHFAGSVGIGAAIIVVAAVIIAATKSSCPFVSAYDGSDFSLQGEIYGGAIYPQLVRHDYLPLRMAPLPDGSLQLKISNELKERQYTDLAELIVIAHDSDVRVLADEQGVLHTISELLPPCSAMLGDKIVTAPLSQAGDDHVLYLDDATPANGINELFLSFNKPEGVTQCKLVLSLKNSYFLDLLYGDITKALGSYYDKYVEKQRKRPADELNQWVKDQQMPLRISVQIQDDWIDVVELTTIGPIAFRDIVVPLDLIAQQDTILNIKLSSGFLFWEVDYASCDFTSSTSFKAEYLLPAYAVDEQNHTVTSKLCKEDGIYLEQPQIGNVTTLEYHPGHKEKGMTYSYILHAKGYYEHIREYTGAPDVEFLEQFKRPGALPVYAMTKYEQIKHSSGQWLASNN